MIVSLHPEAEQRTFIHSLSCIGQISARLTVSQEPHEWDPSVLDYSYPSDDGEPKWSIHSNDRFSFDPNFDEFQHMTPLTGIWANQHVLSTNKHVLSNDAPDYENLRPYFGWVNVDTVQKTIEKSTQWGVSIPNTFLMKRHLKSRNPALT